MDKLINRVGTIALLVVWVTLVCAGDWHPQYRSMGINTSSDAGKIVFFITYVILSEVGKKLDKGAKCPVYCGVNHKHRMIEYDIQKEERIDKETDPRGTRSDIIAVR